MKVCDAYRNDFLNITEETPTLDIEQYGVFKFQSGWRYYTMIRDALCDIGTRIHKLYNAGNGCYVGISYNNVIVIVSKYDIFDYNIWGKLPNVLIGLYNKENKLIKSFRTSFRVWTKTGRYANLIKEKDNKEICDHIINCNGGYLRIVGKRMSKPYFDVKVPCINARGLIDPLNC